MRAVTPRLRVYARQTTWSNISEASVAFEYSVNRRRDTRQKRSQRVRRHTSSSLNIPSPTESSPSAKAVRVHDDGKTLADFIIASSAASSSKLEGTSHHNKASEMSLPHEFSMDVPLIKPNKSVYIETYGCQMNSADSELVRSVLLGAGYTMGPSATESDVIFLNTCAIRENAESRIWERLKVLKAFRRKKKVNRGKIVGVLGCMAERLKTKLLEADNMVDLVAGPDAYRDLPNLLDIVGSGQKAVNIQLSLEETYADIAPVRESPNSPSAYVSIMRGCNNMCSYCIVPFTRGRERSRNMWSIADEVKRLSDEGVKEITLLGQNVNSYHDIHSEGAAVSGRTYVSAKGFKNMFRSRDKPGYRLVDLLDEVSRINPEMRIRFTSPHPKDFPDQLLELIAERHNICNSLHLPAQSGSTKILEAMRRGYTREAYLELIDRVRDIIPGVAISSDFISGFCGESEDDHADTLSLLRAVRYDHAFMFAYSLRERTHAAYKLEDDVPEEVKTRRLNEVISTFREVVSRKNKLEDEGRLHVVLVEGTSRRSTTESPELQGRTDTNKRIVLPDVECLPSLDWIKPAYLSSSQTLLDASGSALNGSEKTLGSARLQVGDYALVRVYEAGSHTLKSQPIARASLADIHRLIPADLLGPKMATIVGQGESEQLGMRMANE